LIAPSLISPLPGQLLLVCPDSDYRFLTNPFILLRFDLLDCIFIILPGAILLVGSWSALAIWIIVLLRSGVAGLRLAMAQPEEGWGRQGYALGSAALGYRGDECQAPNLAGQGWAGHRFKSYHLYCGSSCGYQMMLSQLILKYEHEMSINELSYSLLFSGLFVAFTYNKKQAPDFGATPAFWCILLPFLGLSLRHIPKTYPITMY
ncbi:hypothetical protein AMTR_s04495p00001190, partial [Amborella trichopoda]